MNLSETFSSLQQEVVGSVEGIHPSTHPSIRPSVPPAAVLCVWLRCSGSCQAERPAGPVLALPQWLQPSLESFVSLQAPHELQIFRLPQKLSGCHTAIRKHHGHLFHLVCFASEHFKLPVALVLRRTIPSTQLFLCSVQAAVINHSCFLG